MKTLSKNAEELLREILSNRYENGNCNLDYWANKFNSLPHNKNCTLRCLFNELSSQGFISVEWGSNKPHIMSVLPGGISYFEQRNVEGVCHISVNNYFSGNMESTNINQTLVVNQSDDSAYEDKINQIISLLEQIDDRLETNFSLSDANRIRRFKEELSYDTSDKKKIWESLKSFLKDVGANVLAELILRSME